MNVKLLFFAGSARKDSLNKKLARAAEKTASEMGAETSFIDLADFPMPIYHGDLESEDGVPENAKKLADIVRAHQGIFIACPEYNSSITPLLKNTLDWVTRMRTGDNPPKTPWQGRVFAIGSTSMGPMGGLRGLTYTMGLLATGYQVMTIPQNIAVGKGHEVLDDDGNINNPQTEAMMMNVMKTLIETTAKHCH